MPCTILIINDFTVQGFKFYFPHRQFYVPIPIMWPTLSKYAARYTKNDLAAELAFRTFMVLVTRKWNRIHSQKIPSLKWLSVSVLLAAAIPKIDLFISLVGAFGSSFLVKFLNTFFFVKYNARLLNFYFSQALIFPPLLEYVTYAPNISKLTITKEILILLFGVIGFATGTYAAILAIVQEFTGSD